MGIYAKALEYFENSLKISLRLLGEDYFLTASCYNNIGIVYTQMNKNQKALEYFLKFLKILLKLKGEYNL